MSVYNAGNDIIAAFQAGYKQIQDAKAQTFQQEAKTKELGMAEKRFKLEQQAEQNTIKRLLFDLQSKGQADLEYEVGPDPTGASAIPGAIGLGYNVKPTTFELGDWKTSVTPTSHATQAERAFAMAKKMEQMKSDVELGGRQALEDTKFGHQAVLERAKLDAAKAQKEADNAFAKSLESIKATNLMERVKETGNHQVFVQGMRDESSKVNANISAGSRIGAARIMADSSYAKTELTTDTQLEITKLLAKSRELMADRSNTSKEKVAEELNEIRLKIAGLKGGSPGNKVEFGEDTLKYIGQVVKGGPGSMTDLTGNKQKLAIIADVHEKGGKLFSEVEKKQLATLGTIYHHLQVQKRLVDRIGNWAPMGIFDNSTTGRGLSELSATLGPLLRGLMSEVGNFSDGDIKRVKEGLNPKIFIGSKNDNEQQYRSLVEVVDGIATRLIPPDRNIEFRVNTSKRWGIPQSSLAYKPSEGK